MLTSLAPVDLVSDVSSYTSVIHAHHVGNLLIQDMMLATWPAV